MSAFQILATGLLKHSLKRTRSGDLALEVGVFRRVSDAVNLAGTGCGCDRDGHGPFFVVQAFQALLSAVVLRALPLCGERIHAALRVVGSEGRDAAATADLRLLHAFLAARNGYFNEALDMYKAAARDHPSDPRPRYLAHHLCDLAGLKEEADKWLASYDKVIAAGTGSPSLHDQAALCTLAEEVVVALALGVGFVVADEDARFPVVMRKILGASGSRVDAALVSALQGKEMSLVERLEVWAARAFLHAGVWSALKEFKSKIDSASTTATANK